MKFIFILCLYSTFAFGQPYSDFIDYIGAPGSVNSNIVKVPSGTVLKIQLSTLDISDSLIINYCEREYKFFVGSQGFKQPGYSLYGFNKFNIYSNDIDTIYINSHINDPEFDLVNFPYPSGKLLIYLYIQDCCSFKWKLCGNDTFTTQYTMLIQTSIVSYWSDRIVTVPRCGKYQSNYDIVGCERIHYIYSDSSIYDDPIINQPSCENSNDGTIIFPNHPEFNVTNVPSGPYHIVVSNSVCVREYDINLSIDHFCNLFIPNCFNPIYENFQVFSAVSELNNRFTIEIFDRWGDLKFKDINCVTNQFYWDGLNCPIGVYTYKISFQNGDVIFGDVTLLR